MSAGPGPPKSPAPHPPRRGHNITAGGMTRYRSVREHKSVLDFGRDWRDWDVDIFQDDETASNATTDTGTATSIGICIGIAVDEEAIVDETQAAQTSTPTHQQRQQQQQQQKERPASAARRRTTPLMTSFAPTPQTPTGAPQLTLQWQWHDLMSASAGSDENGNSNNMMMNKFGFDGGSPVNRGNGAGTGRRIPVRPDSPVRFSYPNRRRPKTAPNGASFSPPYFPSSPSSFASRSPAGPYANAGGPSPSPRPRPPSEPGSLFSLARSRSGSRSPVPGVSSTQTPLYSLGPCPPVPSAGSALLQQAAGTSAADAATRDDALVLAPAPGTVPPLPLLPPPPPPPLEPPPPIPTRARDQLLLPLPSPPHLLRPRSHNPTSLSSQSCTDLKLSARADHARSQIITKLALQPVPDDEHISIAQRDHHLAREDEQRQRQQAEQEEEDRRRREQEAEDAARWAAEVTRLEEETDRILAEQKAKDLARLQAQLDAIPDAPPRVRSPIVDKFASFLRKGRRSDPTTLTKASSAYFQPLTRDCRPVSDMDPSRFIQAGGGGIVPQTDAPTSASNAGERRVTVRCLQSSISLPVTPDTTPTDILYSAANLMTHNINPQTSVVLECYFAYGLERHLRRYERVRDVMNSWDRDSQHCLLIVPGGSVDKNPELNLEGVPRTFDPPPGLVNFALYHCNRPGKWNKRYITLLDSGQIFAAKKKDAKMSDKDAVSLCHLSDFDIYAVTEKDMLKRVKAPKKTCIVVKSQQKNSVFQNTENFIHFFATDDARLANDFQRVVHGWRSWYLVNKKVDLTKKTKSHHGGADKAGGLARNGTVHRARPLADETPYTIGTFSPLLDMDKFEKPIDDYGKDADKSAARPLEQLSTPQNTNNVVSRSRTTPNISPPAGKRLIDPFAKDQEFRSAGLLGRGYEGRKLQAEKTAAEEQQQYTSDSPFTGGNSLLNQVAEPDRPLERRGTVRSSRPTAADPNPLPRSRSRPPPARLPASSRPRTSDGGSASGKREMPQPLVDLTPRVPDLPSTWREAQGRGVRVPNGKPLIEMATGWDQPDAALGPQPQTITRMATTKAYPPQRMASQSAASRPRSRSTAGGGGGAAMRRVVSSEQPPVPSMPRRSRRDDEDLPLINFVERDRSRDTKPRAPQGLGRSGTVRY
ncbi:hypothetical protein CSUB01_00181 [Colletotrichum sublineola]|uniref:PH domain-containing protein n=1 Tax=Colletotrichum sublineola TaxID=1173701 RepID=A0A066X2C2_COLSU|nr:hypothetical protein CSUB01_00181 [Colletotrichum sublineola]